MATIQIHQHTVSVRFTRTEKLTGLVRDLDVSRAAVVSATVARDGLQAARGLRAPGLAVPGRRKVGTWRRAGRRSVVSVRRNEPALSLELRGAPYDHLLIGTPEAQALAAQLGEA